MTPQHQRDAALQHRTQLLALGFTVQAAEEEAARTCRVDPRSVRRWAAASRAADIEPTTAALTAAAQDDSEPVVAATAGPFRVDERMLAAVAAHRVLKDAWKDLRAEGVVDVSYRTFSRAFSDQLHPGVSAALRGRGAADLQSRQLYLRQQTPTCRNEMWEADAQEVPVWVLAPRGRVVKPWQVTFIDVATRAVTASIIVENHPNAADVKAAFALAVHGHDLALPGQLLRIEGKPGGVVVDNGGEFIGEAFTLACADRSVGLWPTNAYSAWQKPHIERWHRTIQTELYSKMVGYADGPMTHTRKRLFTPTEANIGQLMSIEMLRDAVQDWVDFYNAQRPHSSLNGLAPAQVYAADPRPLMPVPDELMLDCWYADPRPRKLNKNGLHFQECKWAAPELATATVREVEVRWLPMRRGTEQVGVMAGKKLLCWAVPAAAMSDAARRQVLLARRDQYTTWRRATTAADKQRRRATADVLYSGGLLSEQTLALPVEDDIAATLLQALEDTERRSAAAPAEPLPDETDAAEPQVLTPAPAARPRRARKSSASTPAAPLEVGDSADPVIQQLLDALPRTDDATAPGEGVDGAG